MVGFQKVRDVQQQAESKGDRIIDMPREHSERETNLHKSRPTHERQYHILDFGTVERLKKIANRDNRSLDEVLGEYILRLQELQATE
ncbi:MAG: hypothetical protein XD95_0033 [Microgenomates bacterium 39_7]|nr:MAG: hypothetical protein XD95_0033 [Microgenomates bacterium 39_7]